jgi:hypothetical protein
MPHVAREHTTDTLRKESYLAFCVPVVIAPLPSDIAASYVDPSLEQAPMCEAPAIKGKLSFVFASGAR